MEYGIKELFSIKSLSVYTHDKIGIVGENGTGKTTLLDVVAKKTSPLSGSVNLLGDFSYITQGVDYTNHDNRDLDHYKWSVYTNPYSGGEVTRAKIADALEKQSDILLCDEPTSNLDEKGIKKLEKALLDHKGSVLLVSHDRMLLDKVCNKIWEIKDGEVKVYSGNYSNYKQESQKLIKNQQKEYEKYIQTKKSLQSALTTQSRKAKSMTKTPKRMGNSEARLHRMDVRQRAGKVSDGAKAIRNRLESLEVKQKPKSETSYKMLGNHTNTKLSKVAIEVNNLSFGYDEIDILNDVSFVIERGDKLCITGDNGSGKTTLINCIIEKSGGVRINPSDEIGYFRQNCLELKDDKTILESVMQNSKLPEHLVRTVLAELGIKRDDVYKKIHMLSGGEKCKVSLSSLLCQTPSILILDEPTNYLDIYVLEALEKMLSGYNGTLIIVSHDRYFRQKVTNKELIIKNGKAIIKQDIKPKEISDIKTKLMVLELKASELIERKKGLSDIQQEGLERKYQSIMSEIKEMKKILR